MNFFNEITRNYICSVTNLEKDFSYEQFKVGRSNITFKIKDQKNSYVLRRPPFGEKLESKLTLFKAVIPPNFRVTLSKIKDSMTTTFSFFCNALHL